MDVPWRWPELPSLFPSCEVMPWQGWFKSLWAPSWHGSPSPSRLSKEPCHKNLVLSPLQLFQQFRIPLLLLCRPAGFLGRQVFLWVLSLRVLSDLAAADRAAVLHNVLIAAPSMTLPCFSALRSLCGAHIARGHPVTMWMAGVHLWAQLCPHCPHCLTLLLSILQPLFRRLLWYSLLIFGLGYSLSLAEIMTDAEQTLKVFMSH